EMLAFFRERRYESGERLPSERALAEKFGVGRNALREALSTLSTLRVIESRPNSGIYLRQLSTESSFETIVLLSEMGAPPSPREVRETLEVRWALEQQAVLLACERRTDSDLERIQTILARAQKTLADGGNIYEDDTAFHIALVQASHNDVLVRLLNSFYRLTQSRRRLLFSTPRRGKESARDHRQIFEMIKARDAVRASALMQAHMDRARMYWKEILGTDGVDRVDREGGD
ncbi:MAG: FadR/GntR family transcriptional regulator, partial [Janthinobacterium lividum]